MTSVIITNKPATSWHGKSHHRTGAGKFLAVDGEGVTLNNGEHRYVLLRVGTSEPVENPLGLHWREIFEYLYSHYQKGIAFTGFYLGYDFTQWFRTLPEDRAWYLLSKEGVASRRRIRKKQGVEPLPVECGRWQFDIMSGRRFWLRPKICRCKISLCQCTKPPWMYICDAGGFFQTSFIVAINPAKWPEPILTEIEYKTICTGKEARSSAHLDDDMRYYNRLENDVMARLMARTDEGLRRLGVTLTPKQWFSPAQAAQKWMRGKVPTREVINERVPYSFRDAARSGYIAGWFEIFMHGRIPGITYQYDINSAYPSIACKLPCLLHGHYSSGQGKPRNPPELTLVKCDVTVPKHQARRYIGAMMHRFPDGRIARPVYTGGWYWLHELRAAIRAGVCRIVRYLQWEGYDPCDCPPPLQGLSELYQERLRQGKDTPLGRAARLVYNCVYGKLAQNVGLPEFMNFIYASLITAGCRSQILDAIASHPGGKKAVVQVATDAVYFLSPHPGLSVSKKLGDWDTKEHHHMTVFKPGVYWDDDAREQIAAGDQPQFKARGVSARDMSRRLSAIDSEFSGWDHNAPRIGFNHYGKPSKKDSDEWPSTEFVPSFQMITAKQALMSRKWMLAGTLKFEPVKQSSWPGDKRQDAYWDDEIGVIRSEPRRHHGVKSWDLPGGDELRSQPYKDLYTQANPDNPMSDESREKFGLTPDGPVDQLMIDAMMPERKWTQNVVQKGKNYHLSARAAQ